MERHCQNAMEVAKFLEGHPAVAKVNYTGLTSHPDHAIARKQMRHPGAMMSFELKGGLEAGVKLMNKLKLCLRTVSLGTTESLLCHPASMTHFSVPKDQRQQYGISDGLIRMSVGIENVKDIISDLEQGMIV
jgi:methionine-gamma-lyase